ncbi:MAG: hypothetical protein AAB548_02910, partial [Patescibacteria group bacterium]
DTLPDNNDTRLIAYIIGQVQNNLLRRQPLFYGTFFAPYDNTLTYSEPFVTTAVISLPFRLLTSSPITIFNFSFLLATSLTFAASFLLFAYLTKDSLKGLFAALLFNLSGFHLAYLPHLQLYSLWPFFSALYCFCRYQREEKSLFLHLFFLFTFLQLADSFLPVYFLFLICLIYWLQKPKHFLQILLSGLPFFLCVFIFLSPYLALPKTFPEAVRPIRDAAHFSLGLEEVFTKYRSWTIIILLFLTLRGPTSKLKPYFIILTSSLLLAFGPVVKAFGHTVKVFGLPLPLPYTLFYYFFPGFQGLRTPSRFIVLALIAASAIIATRLPKKPLLYTLVISLLLFEAGLPRPGYTIDAALPPVYAKVKALPQDAVILELPILLWNQPGHEIESVRSLYSLDHGHRRVGGFSGFAPLAWIDLVGQINASGLNLNNISRLKSLGVTHLVENNHLQPLQ